ncbi:16835_t:CDS:2, partial [Acaulospora colombiana]
KSTQSKPAQPSENAPYANPIYSNPHGSLKQPYSHINTISIFALRNALLRMNMRSIKQLFCFNSIIKNS